MALPPALFIDADTWLFDRYSIIHQIGSGGSGRVYLAHDTQTQRRVCIKYAADSLREEAELLAAEYHPRTPKMLELRRHGAYWYLVMEYIPGVTLLEYLQRRMLAGQRISVDEVLSIGAQVAAILTAFHRQRPPLVVCDVKPENLMRTPNGTIYLIDFGIARLDPRPDPGSPRSGSRGYIPREYMTDGHIGPERDVYGLGATLHHLLTGVPPCRCGKERRTTSCSAACFAPRRLRGPVGQVVNWMLDPVYQERPRADELLLVFDQLRTQRSRYGIVRRRLSNSLARVSFF